MVHFNLEYAEAFFHAKKATLLMDIIGICLGVLSIAAAITGVAMDKSNTVKWFVMVYIIIASIIIMLGSIPVMRYKVRALRFLISLKTASGKGGLMILMGITLWGMGAFGVIVGIILFIYGAFLYLLYILFAVETEFEDDPINTRNSTVGALPRDTPASSMEV
eukprot:TRINITY_DN12682_c0_g1_i2.p1 TRINITY_DN12682_c0_g1~~TRINITY_DN12682_c0_g1_i2.p1  ORF type:complete len:163 (-),score=16.77 TRINITY_DN12682_c0_g1_i2:127-615(-)